MIRSFSCQETKLLFERHLVRKIPIDIQRVALRKLKMLDASLTSPLVSLPSMAYVPAFEHPFFMNARNDPDHLWYALANMEVVLAPRKLLETFGTTVLTYHLISEKMDAVNEIRIREGRVHAERPQVLTPTYFERLLLDGFGEEAHQYTDWLRAHVHDLTFLKYGFRFRKEETQESTVHENMDAVAARVKAHVEERDEPLTTVIKGMDDAWEICLLKFMTDTIRKSAPENVLALKKRKLLEEIEGVPLAIRHEIEQDFLAAGSDSSKMKTLGNKLRHYGIFEAYEDRFYELVRHCRK